MKKILTIFAFIVSLTIFLSLMTSVGVFSNNNDSRVFASEKAITHFDCKKPYSKITPNESISPKTISNFRIAKPSTNEREKELTTAAGAVLMEASSRRVLYERNAHARMEMASTTKIITALVAIENSPLDAVVTVDRRAVGIEGSSIYLREGEHLTLKELLFGLMLRSGNDAAVQVALFVGGSVENFVKMMNDKAKSLGLTDTNFTNPHGLHDEDHYTSAYDLAVISSVAMCNSNFREIVGAKKATISNEFFDYQRLLTNKNKLLFSNDYANGVKIGYTVKAGRCFVGSGIKSGMQLVAVVLRCGDMFADCARMLEFGFDNFYMKNVIPSNKLCGAEMTRKGATYFTAKDSFSFPVRLDRSEDDKIAKTITLRPNAEISVQFDGANVHSQPLISYKSSRNN